MYFLRWFLFTAMLVTVTSLNAADIYLSSSGNDANNGSTAQLAVKTFSKAQEIAVSGDVIIVKGMIDFSTDLLITKPLGVSVTKNLTIQGSSNVTDGFDGKGLTRFLNITNFTVVLKDLKLVNGFSDANNGGGLIINTATNSLTCENVIFDGNKTGLGGAKTGAALHIDNVNGATFKKCIFSNNEASKTGAIYINSWAASSTIHFEGCSFLSNIAKETFGGSALYIRASTSANTTLNLINCTFKGNSVLNTTATGGTIAFSAKSPATTNVNIINCTVTENKTAGAFDRGAGVYFLNTTAGGCWGNLYISNSIIEGNTAADGSYCDLHVAAPSPTTAGGGSASVPGYILLRKSIIGRVTSVSTNIPVECNPDNTNVGYLTETSTAADLKAKFGTFNSTLNYYPLTTGSAAINYGASIHLSSLIPPVNTDQIGTIRPFTNGSCHAGSVEIVQAATPEAPTSLVATAGNSQITVTFIAGGNGGSPITGYKYSLNGGAYSTAVQTASPIIITGLTNGTAYTVKLKAVNANGDGAESASSNSVTPFINTGFNNNSIPEQEVSIYRNATNNLIVKTNSVAFKSGRITIYNSFGQAVGSFPLNRSDTAINDHFVSGVYIVLVNIDGKTISRKIVLN